MLRVAFADDASHAVALHNFAVLTDRLHACANFHRRSGRNENLIETKISRTDTNSNKDRNFKQGDGLVPFSPTVPQASSWSTASMAARRSGAAVTIRPTTTY